MNDARQLKTPWSDHLMVILMVAIIALLPFGRLSELPLLATAVWGLFNLITKFSSITKSNWFKSFSWVYLMFLLLSVISSLDSYWPDKSWLVSLGSVRFYLSGVALLSHKHLHAISQRILKWLVLLIMLWGIDALVQASMGSNLLGMSSYPGRLTGVFGQNVKLGPVLALFLPLVLVWSCQLSRLWRWILVTLVLTVILLSGTRSAWLMVVFVMLMFWWHHVQGRRFILLTKVLLVGLLGMTALYFISNDFQQRIERSAQIFQGDAAGMDFALADRLPIWKTAINMYQDHPVNGVGARAFRNAYDEYAEAGDVWVMQHGTGLHAHHWVLELMAETGTIGLVLFVVLLMVVFSKVKSRFQRNSVWPYAVALMAALLPVVSLYSLFSSFWSICLWWLLVMLFAGVKDE